MTNLKITIDIPNALYWCTYIHNRRVGCGKRLEKKKEKQ